MARPVVAATARQAIRAEPTTTAIAAAEVRRAFWLRLLPARPAATPKRSSSLSAGASGYLLKDSTAEGLTAAIRSVHRGGSVIAPSTTRRLLASRTEPGPTRTTAAIDGFTGRERDVFDLIVAGASNAEIAQRLQLAEVTVKTHVGRVLAKLGVRDRVNIVIWAYRNGAVR